MGLSLWKLHLVAWPAFEATPRKLPRHAPPKHGPHVILHHVAKASSAHATSSSRHHPSPPSRHALLRSHPRSHAHPASRYGVSSREHAPSLRPSMDAHRRGGFVLWQPARPTPKHLKIAAEFPTPFEIPCRSVPHHGLGMRRGRKHAAACGHAPFVLPCSAEYLLPGSSRPPPVRPPQPRSPQQPPPSISNRSINATSRTWLCGEHQNRRMRVKMSGLRVHSPHVASPHPWRSHAPASIPPPPWCPPAHCVTPSNPAPSSPSSTTPSSSPPTSVIHGQQMTLPLARRLSAAAPVAMLSSSWPRQPRLERASLKSPKPACAR